MRKHKVSYFLQYVGSDEPFSRFSKKERNCASDTTVSIDHKMCEMFSKYPATGNNRRAFNQSVRN